MVRVVVIAFGYCGILERASSAPAQRETPAKSYMHRASRELYPPVTGENGEFTTSVLRSYRIWRV